MAITDPLGDMLARIRNGQQAKLKTIKSPSSKLRVSVLEVLKSEGYIVGYSVAKDDKGFDEISIELKYFDEKGVIKEIHRVSKPSRRVYSKIKDLPKYYNGLGVSIVSTPQGVMTDHNARKSHLGGEVLAKVF
jgi:small subunit ribosomal protein S8